MLYHLSSAKTFCASAADRHIKRIGGSTAQSAVDPQCTHERSATNARWAAADARGWAARASSACAALHPDDCSPALRLSIGYPEKDA